MKMYGIGWEAGNCPRLRRARHSWPLKGTLAGLLNSAGPLLAYWRKIMPIITWMSILTIRVAGGIASSRFLIVIGEIGAPRIFLCLICETMYLLGSFNLQKKYWNEAELTAHMNDNFETPYRQLFGQPWDIFRKTFTQFCDNFGRRVYLCPALWVAYGHSLHQKKTLIDLRLMSYLLSPKKLPGTRVCVGVPHNVWQLVTRHRVKWLR